MNPALQKIVIGTAIYLVMMIVIYIVGHGECLSSFGMTHLILGLISAAAAAAIQKQIEKMD
jgi:hypothetical protein